MRTLLTAIAAMGAAALASPALASAATISGQVDDGVNPIEGICVNAHNASAPQPFSGPVFSAQTTALGTYEINGVPAGSYKVQFFDCPEFPGADTGDYVEEWYDNKANFGLANQLAVTADQTLANIDASLQPAGHITGHVGDAGNAGADLEGICVNAHDANAPQFSGQAFFGQTNADGDYDIGGLPAGSYKVQFFDCPPFPAPPSFSPDYVEQWYQNKANFGAANPVTATAGETTANINASMQPAGHITGHVGNAAAAGADLEGICVNAHKADAPPFSGQPPFFGRSNADGDYDIGGLPAGSYKVQFFDCPAGPPGPPGSFSPDWVEQWYDGSPLDGGAPNFSHPSTVALTVATGQTRQNINAFMQPAGHITGHVGDAGAGGADLEGICISAHDADAPPFSGRFFSTQTDAQGNYDLGGLPAGSYKVQFFDCPPFPAPPSFSPDYVTQWYDGSPLNGGAPSFDHPTTATLTVAAGQTLQNINAFMQPAGHITGHVEDAGDSANLQGICVNAHPANAEPFSSPFFGTQTDAQGNYDLGGLPAGNYKVQFWDCPSGFSPPPGFSPDYVTQWYDDKPDFGTADQVAVAANQTTPNIDASMQPGGHITGHVEDAGTQADLQGICVTALNANAPPNEGGFFNAQTNAQGDYDIGGLPAGSYKVAFGDCRQNPTHISEWWDNESSFETADVIVVAAGATVTGKDAGLALGRTISGTVENDQGQGLPEICVNVVNANDEEQVFEGPATDGNGNYTTEVLPPGQYKLEFNDCGPNPRYLGEWWDNESSFTSADSIDVTTANASGKDAVLTAGKTISGQVTNAADEALQGICVAAVDPNDEGAHRGGADTNEEGEYVMVVPAGHYKVVFSDCNEPATYVSQWWNGETDFDSADDVDATSADVSGVNAELTEGRTISGQVTSDGTTGIPNVCVGAVQANNEEAFVGGGETDANGDYTTEPLPPGHYKVLFSHCNDLPTYLEQWWDDQPDFASADDVDLTSANATNVDAELVNGGGISGTVEGTPARAALGEICVRAEATDLSADGSALTGPDGSYRIGSLPAGNYNLRFSDCRSDQSNGIYPDQFVENVLVVAGVYTQNVDTDLGAPDNAAPETSITSGPSGTTNSRSAAFAFTADEPVAHFECRLDGGDWQGCDSPASYDNLGDGSHAFEVRATDFVGHVDASPASRTWSVDTTPTDGTTPPTGNAQATTLTASLFGRATQRAGRFIAVGVACGNAACTATARGSVNVPGVRTARRFALRPARASIPSNGRRTLRLRVPPRALKAIRRALRARRRVTASVSVTARDAAGASSTKRRTIRLKR